MSKKILVIGGAGYVGGAVTDLLQQSEHDVRVYDARFYEETYRKQIKQLGTADAVRMLEGLVEGNFLVLNGDIIAGHKDIKKLAARRRNTVSVTPVEDATGLGVVALEEAIGQPTEIFVVLPDSPWRLAVGAVFSYYEFTVSASNRMTDEQWQATVESGQAPPQPEWTEAFIAP